MHLSNLPNELAKKPSFGSAVSASSQLQPDCAYPVLELPPVACGNVPIDYRTGRAGGRSTGTR